MKATDDAGTTKATDDAPTLKTTDEMKLTFADDTGRLGDVPSLKFRDDLPPPSIKFQEDQTLKLRDDTPTLKLADDRPSLKFQHDPTLKFRDETPTVKFLDDPGPTLKTRDDGPSLKLVDDGGPSRKILDDGGGIRPPNWRSRRRSWRRPTCRMASAPRRSRVILRQCEPP